MIEIRTIFDGHNELTAVTIPDDDGGTIILQDDELEVKYKFFFNDGSLVDKDAWRTLWTAPEFVIIPGLGKSVDVETHFSDYLRDSED